MVAGRCSVSPVGAKSFCVDGYYHNFLGVWAMAGIREFAEAATVAIEGLAGRVEKLEGEVMRDKEIDWTKSGGSGDWLELSEPSPWDRLATVEGNIVDLTARVAELGRDPMEEDALTRGAFKIGGTDCD